MGQTRLPRLRYADFLLGRSTDDFIAERRSIGVPYRRIARELADATNGEIDVSDVTIRAWDLRRQSESAA